MRSIAQTNQQLIITTSQNYRRYDLHNILRFTENWIYKNNKICQKWTQVTWHDSFTDKWVNIVFFCFIILFTIKFIECRLVISGQQGEAVYLHCVVPASSGQQGSSSISPQTGKQRKRKLQVKRLEKGVKVEKRVSCDSRAHLFWYPHFLPFSSCFEQGNLLRSSKAMLPITYGDYLEKGGGGDQF